MWYAGKREALAMAVIQAQNALWRRWESFRREQRGDMVSALGWMAIMALLLVTIKGIVDGKLTGYVNSIFSYLDRVFNPS
jgi:hypothetical protein